MHNCYIKSTLKKKKGSIHKRSKMCVHIRLRSPYLEVNSVWLSLAPSCSAAGAAAAECVNAGLPAG